MVERMIVTDGKVFVDDGEVTGVDFKACVVTLGKAVRLYDCTFDPLSEIKTAGADEASDRIEKGDIA